MVQEWRKVMERGGADQEKRWENLLVQEWRKVMESLSGKGLGKPINSGAEVGVEGKGGSPDQRTDGEPTGSGVEEGNGEGRG